MSKGSPQNATVINDGSTILRGRCHRDDKIPQIALRFAITRDGQKYKRKRKAEVVNEHIEPCSGFRFIIVDACDFTITPV